MGVLWNLILKQVQILIGSISFVLQIIVNQIGLDKKKQQAAKGRKCEMGVLLNLSLKQVQTLIFRIYFIVNQIGLDKYQQAAKERK